MTTPGPYGPYGPPMQPGPGFASPGVPAPVGVPAGPDPASSKPVSGVGYWVGALAMVFGVGLASALFTIGVGRAVDAFTFPDVVDASGGVWIDDAGGKVIYVISPETVGTTRPLVTDPGVSVTDPDGGPVDTAHYEGVRSTTDYDEATGTSRDATAVATFEADRPGRYQLAAVALPTGSTLGVGEGVDGNFTELAVGGVGAGFLVLGGMVLIIVTAVRRRRNRPTYPWYPGPPTMMGPPGYGLPVSGYGYPAPGSFAPPSGGPPTPGVPTAPPDSPGSTGPGPRWWD